MKRKIIIAILCASMFFPSSVSFAYAAEDKGIHVEQKQQEREFEKISDSKNLSYQDGKILVSFPYGTSWKKIEKIVKREAVSYEVIDHGKFQIDETLPSYKKERLEPLRNVKKDIVILVELTSKDTVSHAVKRFLKYDCVTSATKNTYLEADGEVIDDSGANVKLNDPFFEQERYWHLKATNIPQAWARFSSEEEIHQVTVAVIDNGVDMDHPDLDDVLLTEKCVDVTKGKKDKPKDTTVTKLITRPSKASNKGQFTGAHGTTVVGILAAEANNGIMGAGAASIGNNDKFKNHIKIMAIKCDEKTKGKQLTVGYLAKAINYAVSNGAEVINISYNVKESNLTAPQKKQLETAIKNARKARVVVVCSTGNHKTDEPCYPAAFDGVIGVGSINSHGEIASYTNLSEDVDILAPSGDGEKDGQALFTTRPIVNGQEKGYGYVGGSSYAAPQVSAAAAMMLCLNYDLTPKQVQNRLVGRRKKWITSDEWKGHKFPVLDTGKSVRLTKSK